MSSNYNSLAGTLQQFTAAVSRIAIGLGNYIYDQQIRHGKATSTTLLMIAAVNCCSTLTSKTHEQVSTVLSQTGLTNSCKSLLCISIFQPI